ncbi:uncharacterized protein LOC141637231 [Silene latifolia]|uniref:uncharacterized protein LOC141637231 n=1 Tax=Silene latifolia TaxID=37657 RepID=UPI003D784782
MEIPTNFQVQWQSNGTYKVNTPAKGLIRLSRQELINQGSCLSKFRQYSFMDALNNATPKVGVYLSILDGIKADGYGYCGNLNFIKSIAFGVYLPILNGIKIECNAQLIHDSCEGSYFTWNNKLEVATRVYSRLDMALVNHAWISERSEYYAHFHVEGYFDHTPCVIQRYITDQQKKKCFKYFNMWGGVDQLLPTVQMVWENRILGTPMYQMVRKLKLLKKPLKDLNRGLFDDMKNNSMRAWKHLEYVQEQLRTNPTNVDLINTELNALKDYQELKKACDSFLLQKSKAIWLTEGDNNTKTFHSYMKSNQARNKVLRIADEQGRWLTNVDAIQQAFLNFYKKLLGETTALQPINMQVVQRGPICTEEHWETLLSIVTDSEIKEALFSIPNHKAPEPDGYSSAFFKYTWEIVGNDMCIAVTNFFNQGKLLKQKGLRQGDPLSPLLFTVVMEYLTRIMEFTTEVMPFQFHSLCGKLRLQHLMFAADLLLFARGDKQSVLVLLRYFITFSASSGLQMNNQKSNIYFNGVQRHVKDHIIGLSGCVEGKLLFKYLGVAITAGKLGKDECQVLIEKIIDKIRSFGARKISYAGRLILVKFVLTSLFTYWANNFLLPKGVLRKIDSICRNYLWHGTNIYMRTPLVSWEHIYIKGDPWDSHIPKSHMSGNWKAIYKVKEILKPGYGNGAWLADQQGYNECAKCQGQTLQPRYLSGCTLLYLEQWGGNYLSCISELQVYQEDNRRVYNEVWQQRNQARLDGKLQHPKMLIHQIQLLIRHQMAKCNVVLNAIDKA